MPTDNKRLERLEDKVDLIKDDVSELKSDFKVHVNKMEDKMEVFGEHITGDQKIINHLEPFLKQLPEFSEALGDYKFKKQLRERREKWIKRTTAVLGLVSLLVGISVGVSKLF